MKKVFLALLFILFLVLGDLLVTLAILPHIPWIITEPVTQFKKWFTGSILTFMVVGIICLAKTWDDWEHTKKFLAKTTVLPVLFGFALVASSCNHTPVTEKLSQTTTDSNYVGVNIFFYNSATIVQDAHDFLLNTKAKDGDTIFVFRSHNAQNVGEWMVLGGWSPYTQEDVSNGIEIRKGVLITALRFRKT